MPSKFLGKSSFLIFLTLISVLFLAAAQVAQTQSEATITLARSSYADSIGTAVLADSGAPDFNVFEVTNTSATADIRLDWVKIGRSGGADEDFGTIYLWLLNSGGTRTQLGSSQLFMGQAFIDNLALTIPANSTKTFYITAQVTSAASNGESLGLGIDSPDNIGVTLIISASSYAVAGTVSPVMKTVQKNEADTTPPAAPASIAIAAVGSEPTVRISWTDPADSDLFKVTVYRSTAAAQLGSIVHSSNRGVGIIPITTVEDKNIAVNTPYYYTVKAYDIASNASTNLAQPAITVYVKGLTILLDSSSPAAQNISAGSNEAALAAFKFNAANVDVDITNLGFNGFGGVVGKLYLYIDGSLVASTTASDWRFYDDGIKLTILANSAKVVLLKGDISASAVNGTKIISGFSSLSAKQPNGLSVNAYGLSTKGNELTVASSVASSPTPSPSPSPSPTPGQCLASGTLIKLNGNPKVYVITNCKKKWIRTAEEFRAADYDWSQIQEVAQNVMETYSELQEQISELATLLRGSDGKVYLIKSGQRLWVPSVAAFNALRLRWENVRDASDGEINNYHRARLMRVIGDPKVYYITEAGLKRHIVNAETFLSYGNKWEDILEVTAEELSAYGNNSLIRLEGGDKVYKLENGLRRWIKTAAAFVRLGFDWSQIAPVNQTELNAHAEGVVIE